MSNSKFEIEGLFNDPQPTEYEILVKEVDAEIIPPKYVKTLHLFYTDGEHVEMDGYELSRPVQMSPLADWAYLETTDKKVQRIKVFVDTVALEEDVEYIVDGIVKRIFE